MAIDFLHDKIRRMKNPSMVNFDIHHDCIPNHLLEEEGSFIAAYERFCSELMDELVQLVPAVRFPFDAFVMQGSGCYESLLRLLKKARDLGFFVLLDGPQILSLLAADRAAALLKEDVLPCNALHISPYIGSDSIKPIANICKETSKALFVAVRSPNKSAVDLQDLLTGSRHVNGAAAEMVGRFGENLLDKCGYSRIAASVSAGAPQNIQMLRSKYNRMFLLVDGLDYPGGNAKNCSYGFDRFGHGAIVCAGASVTAAWKDAESDGRDYAELAVQAADRIRKNITRYITIL